MNKQWHVKRLLTAIILYAFVICMMAANSCQTKAEQETTKNERDESMATKGMTVFTLNGEDFTINDPNNAPEFDETAVYLSGQYVTHNGNLYRIVADHAANETWGNTNKTAIKMEDQIRYVLRQIASEFSASQAYVAGNYVTYDGALFRITKDHAENVTWANTHKTAVTMESQLRYALRQVAAEFSVSQAYSVGDYVTHDGSLFRFKKAHAVGAWNASHVEAVKIGQNVGDAESVLYPLTDKTEKLISYFTNDSEVTLPEPTNQAWYVDGSGYQPKDGWQCFSVSVTPGAVYRINAENYDNEADAVVIVVNSTLRTLQKYANAEDRIIVMPENATGVFINRNWRNSPEVEFSICEVDAGYQTFGDNELKNLVNEMTSFAGATVSGNIITVGGQNQGAWSNAFDATSNIVVVEVAFTSSLPTTAVQLAIQKSDESFMYTMINSAAAGSYSAKLTFDAAYHHVYSDAQNFRIIINSINSSETGTITVNKFEVYESSTFQQNELYDRHFVPMMEKVFAKTSAIENKVNQIDNAVKSGVCDPNGNKYSLQLLENGEIIAVPHVPTDVLFMGNSLLLGMDTSGEHGGAFGMAATAYTKDFCYLVEQEILANNDSCQFDKIHVASFEMGDWSNYINSYKSQWTNKDCIIMQIGDNVNTTARAETFDEHFPDLVRSIRTLSPNARVFLVGVWFGNQWPREVMAETAERYGCVYIEIADLCVSENFATVGETITYRDGSTGTMEQAWISHPGDKGMQKIADRIIKALDM